MKTRPANTWSQASRSSSRSTSVGPLASQAPNAPPSQLGAPGGELVRWDELAEYLKPLIHELVSVHTQRLLLPNPAPACLRQSPPLEQGSLLSQLSRDVE